MPPFVVATVTDADIVGPVKVSLVDTGGRDLAKFISVPAGTLGFEGPSFVQLQKIAEGLQRINTVRPLVSLKTVSDLIVEWAVNRHLGTVQGAGVLPVLLHGWGAEG